MNLPALTLPALKDEVRSFAHRLNENVHPTLFGATDGKAVGTYVETLFRAYLSENYSFIPGNAALGIDFPDIRVDLKVTSKRQPQSSSPFRDASQKVYGLGYHLLIMVYDKRDDLVLQATRLTCTYAIFVSEEHTADYQTTAGLRGILQRNANRDDVAAFLEERNLPLDEIGRQTLAERILTNPPALGYLTVSNALQWRLQYGRVIDVADQGSIDGIQSLLA